MKYFILLLLILSFSFVEGQTIKPEMRVQMGHSGLFNSVNKIVVVPDGKSFLSASKDKTIKQWDLLTGKEIRTFEGHTGDISNIVMLPEFNTFLTSCADNDSTLKYWDLSTGKEIFTFRGHKKIISSSINQIIRVPGTKTFLTSGFDGTLRYWNLENGKEIYNIKVDNPIFSRWNIVLLPDSHNFLTISEFFSHQIKYWDLKTGSEIRIFNIKNLIQILVSNNKTFLTLAEESFEEGTKIKCWDLKTGNIIWNFLAEDIEQLVSSPDAKTFLTTDSKGIIKQWDLLTGRLIKSFIGHKYSIKDVFFIPNKIKDSGKVRSSGKS